MSPVILEVYVPIPEPLEVLVLNEMIGLGVVDHTTPLEVTLAPPSLVMLPPLTAVVPVIEATAFVVSMGAVNGLVVNVLSGP